MTVASSGDDIEIGNGTYSVRPLRVETFPITIPNDVDLRNGPGSGPVIDGGGAGTLFQITGSITLETRITGLSMQSCATAIDFVAASASISGQLLIIEDCAFSGFTSAAFQAVLDNGNGNQLVFQNCNLDGNNASSGVSIALLNGADLILGQVEDCNIVDCSIGVSLATTDNATVSSNFQIRRNDISDYDFAGILRPGPGRQRRQHDDRRHDRRQRPVRIGRQPARSA